MKIEVDIIIVSFNAEPYIKQALESVFMQRVEDNVNARVIIADDCSTDSTLEIIKSLEPSSPWPFVFLTGEKNIGITANYMRIFNFCVAGHTDYVIVLEGDDYWCSPYHIQKHVDYLDEHREVAMSVNHYNPFYTNEDGSLHIFPQQEDEKYCHVYNLSQMLECNYVGNFSSCTFRKSFLSNIDPAIYAMDVPNIDDWIIGIEMSRFGLVAKLPEYTTMYRLSPNSFYSSKNNKEKMEEIRHRYHLYHEYIGGCYYEKCLEQEKIENWSPFRKNTQKLFKEFSPALIKFASYFLSNRTRMRIKKWLCISK